MKIFHAQSEKEIDIARELFREYQNFLQVDLCFQGFEEELQSLPGKYADPNGVILLAEHNGNIAGCVALRPIEPSDCNSPKCSDNKPVPVSEGIEKICEMKRLYVKDQYQGLSIGKKLAEMVIEQAQKLGYEKMQLDTLKRLDKAMTLYRKLGFYEISPYYANPLDEVVYWELDLQSIK
ncbi:MAG: GNAT family N-acetyltransferase [Gammaproteobacteria bacterium]|nr:GNAT family N-acetyltransferase [Gammaproteobacteria bacterium]MDH5629850.1 GNAT family N-acetyltransferase [Gammaproteobacteria bacterium]